MNTISRRKFLEKASVTSLLAVSLVNGAYAFTKKPSSMGISNPVNEVVGIGNNFLSLLINKPDNGTDLLNKYLSDISDKFHEGYIFVVKYENAMVAASRPSHPTVVVMPSTINVNTAVGVLSRIGENAVDNRSIHLLNRLKVSDDSSLKFLQSVGEYNWNIAFATAKNFKSIGKPLSVALKYPESDWSLVSIAR